MTPRELFARAKAAVGFGRSDRELAQELAFHREMLEERHRARGLSAADARRAARLDLGGDAQIAETWRDQRGLGFADAMRQDVRYGLRMLGRAPAGRTPAGAGSFGRMNRLSVRIRAAPISRASHSRTAPRRAARTTRA